MRFRRAVRILRDKAEGEAIQAGLSGEVLASVRVSTWRRPGEHALEVQFVLKVMESQRVDLYCRKVI